MITKSKWVYDQSDISALKAAYPDMSDVSLKILYDRGYNTPKLVENFFGYVEKDMHDPFLLKDIEKGADIIISAIENDDFIVTYNDYDADGVTSAAMGCILLEKAGARVAHYENNRFIDGYGICKNGIDAILKKYPDVKVIVTADNGIVAYDAVLYAKSKGLRVVITDHHEANKKLPKADAVINPKRLDSTYPFDGLCGAAVMHKLMYVVYKKMGLDRKHVDDCLDIVALGTVADLVPLRDENRIIVKLGIDLIQRDNRLAFKALKEVFAVDSIEARSTLGFKFGPAMNAVGRMIGSPHKAIELFMQSCYSEVLSRANELKEINDSRKSITKEQYEIAEEKLLSKGIKDVIVLEDARFHEGLIGLVASRIKEKYHRPVFIFAHSDSGVLKASGRSIKGFKLKANLDKISPILLSYGGHAMAAGLSIDANLLSKFEEKIIKLANSVLTDEDYVKKIVVDATIKPFEIGPQLLKEFDQLRPFGMGFSEPLLGCEFNVSKYRGLKNKHLKLTSSEGIDALIWNDFEKYKGYGYPSKVRMLGFPSVNEYKGSTSYQFMCKSDLWKVAR